MPSTMVQIRNVPSELHRKLKARAAIEGLSMSDFVLREIRKALATMPIKWLRIALATMLVLAAGEWMGALAGPGPAFEKLR